jgi:hypothetical protein
LATSIALALLLVLLSALLSVVYLYKKASHILYNNSHRLYLKVWHKLQQKVENLKWTVDWDL